MGRERETIKIPAPFAYTYAGIPTNEMPLVKPENNDTATMTLFAVLYLSAISALSSEVTSDSLLANKDIESPDVSNTELIGLDPRS